MTTPLPAPAPGRIAARLSLLAACVLLFAGAFRSPAQEIADCTEEAFIEVELGGDFTFFEDCAITLMNGPIVIAADVETSINADGNEVTISGSSNRLFVVRSGGVLTLEGLTLDNGVHTNGGAIYIEEGGSVVLIDCTLTSNTAVGTNGTAGVKGFSGDLIGGSGSRGTPGHDARGGAIYNLGELTAMDCRFFTNTVVGGNGGDGGDGGDGTFQRGNGGPGGNGGAAFGGAIYSLGTLVLSNSTFDGNAIAGGNGGNGGAPGAGTVAGVPGQGGAGAVAMGAAVYTFQTNFIPPDPEFPDEDTGTRDIIINCTFSDNAVFGGNSGSGSSRFGGSAPRGADALGGGVANVGALAVTNSTFFQNEAFGGNGGDGGRGGGGGRGIGGGLYNTGTVLVVHCTFASGSAFGGTNGARSGGFGPGGRRGQGRGGNMANVFRRDRFAFFLKNSINSTNLGGGGGFGRIFDAGNNISVDRSIPLGRGSYKRTDPRLGTLADNGGPTKTMALLPGSPAIDKVDPAEELTFDQRGIERPQPVGGTNDIGAYEATVLAISLTTDPEGVSQFGATFVTQTNGGPVTFTVSAIGQSPFTYDWYFQRTGSPRALRQPISEPDFIIDAVTSEDAGRYYVIVTDGSGSSAQSEDIFLTVGNNPPVITQQPVGDTVGVGGTATFTVLASGDPTLLYQWRLGTNDIASATNTTYSITNVQPANAGSYTVVVRNPFGSVTSAPAVLTISQAPVITSQPTNQTVGVGGTATFVVAANGEAPLSYQWRQGTNILAGETNTVFSIPNVQTNNAGSYSVVVSNAFGLVTSSTAILTVSQAPVITSQPTSQSVAVGGTALFSVTASGVAPLAYQWKFNGTNNIADATNSTHSVTDAQTSNAGTYSVTITNTFGSVTSANATLTVTTGPVPP